MIVGDETSAASASAVIEPSADIGKCDRICVAACRSARVSPGRHGAFASRSFRPVHTALRLALQVPSERL
jgi:hypothetical protein